MQQNKKTEISSKDQELINYSFEVLLVNVLYKNKEITEEEYRKIKSIIEDKYLNSCKKKNKAVL